MHTTASRDATTIAYDREGDGDPLILVPGAFSYRRYPGQVKLAGAAGGALHRVQLRPPGPRRQRRHASRMPSSARSRISAR